MRIFQHPLISSNISACGIIDQDFYKELAKMIGKPDVDLTSGIAQGGSVIVSPGSTIIGGPLAPNTEGIVYADMDLDMWIKMKQVQDFAGHYNRPDIFTLEVNRSTSGYEEVKK